MHAIERAKREAQTVRRDRTEISKSDQLGGPRTGGRLSRGASTALPKPASIGTSAIAACAATDDEGKGAPWPCGVPQSSAQASLACSSCPRLPFRISRMSAGSSASLARRTGEPFPHQTPARPPPSAMTAACAIGRHNCASQPIQASIRTARADRNRSKGEANN